MTRPIYAKVIAATLAAAAGTLGNLLVELQADGVELHDWLTLLTPVLVFLGGYARRETVDT